MFLDSAQTWTLLAAVLCFAFVTVFRAMFTNIGERVVLTRSSCEDLAREFYRLGIGVPADAEDYPLAPELRWRCVWCFDADSLESALNDELNDGWDVDSITPCPGVGYLLTMNAPRDYITDEDDAYGDRSEYEDQIATPIMGSQLAVPGGAATSADSFDPAGCGEDGCG